MIFWTKDRVETLTQLWNEGHTADYIAKSFGAGATRSAVIGKVQRLGMTGRARPSPPTRLQAARGLKPPKVPADRATAATVKARARLVKKPAAEIIAERAEAVRVAPVFQAKRDAAFEPLPGSTPRPWIERPFGACAWPVGGDGADLLSCCKPKARGAYCTAHAARGYTEARGRSVIGRRAA